MGCAEKFKQISSFYQTGPSGTNNYATFKVIKTIPLPRSDVQFEPPQVVSSRMLKCF